MSARPSGTRIIVFYVLTLLAMLVVYGACARTTVSCSRRGGQVVKNVFDWPTCSNVPPQRGGGQ